MDHVSDRPAGRCLVVGASHEAALREASKNKPLERFEFVNFWALHFSGKQLDSALADIRAAGDDLSLVAIAFGSNAHNRACLIENTEPFGTTDAGGAAVPADMSGRRLIPRDLLRAHLKAESCLMLGLMETVHTAFPHQRCVHLSSPPPVQSMPEGIDLDLLSQEQREFTEMIRRNPVPAALRLEAFRLQTEIYQEEAARRGVPFLPPPEATLTPEGFLGQDFVAFGDPSHANAAYGALVLDQIAAHLRERP